MPHKDLPSPLMRLDANGNTVYYLTDAMGTVIGLVDRTGESSGKFLYDPFGSILSQVGGDTTAGGDFRFQGQWLESESGLYHFRARDYDPETGLFLSRDPVDIIEMAPESFNPYQFVYNNPYVYSDPTGMITLTELNAAQNMQSILANIRTYAGNQAKEYLTGLRRFLWSKKASKLYTPELLHRFSNFLDIPGFERFFRC